MKQIDLNIVGADLGRVHFKDKEIVVKDPTVKQIIKAQKLRGEAMGLNETLRNEAKYSEAFEKWEDFLNEYILIFIPELKMSDILSMRGAQRSVLLDFLNNVEAPKAEGAEGGSNDADPPAKKKGK